MIKRFFGDVPMVFPILSIFFLLVTLGELYFWVGDGSVPAHYRMRPFILLTYTSLWLGATMKKRLFATGFIIYSLLHLGLYLYYWQQDAEPLVNFLGNAMVHPLPLNLGCSAIILFYYKRMK